VVVLGSKRFFIPKGTTIALNYVKEWFDGIDRGLDDCSLVVTLEAMGVERRRKKTALRQLKDLIAGNAAVYENPPIDRWERSGYRFEFGTRKYFWRDREIHITANEALFLYRWLVTEDDTAKVQKHYLYNMRRRLGKEFLADTEE
jgi:hypothetical protein